MPHGLSRPANALWFLWKIQRLKGHRFFFQQHIDYLRHRTDRSLAKSVSLLFRFTDVLERDATHSSSAVMFCRRQGAGMPAGVTKIQTEIDSGKNKIDMLANDAFRGQHNRLAYHSRDRPRSLPGEIFIAERLDEVIAWLIEDCSTSGATMRTSPKRDATLARATIPGL